MWTFCLISPTEDGLLPEEHLIDNEEDNCPPVDVDNIPDEEDDTFPSTNPDNTEGQCNKYILRDGTVLVRRKKPKIIRYVRFSKEKDPEKYFRELLMLFLPWRKEETDLLGQMDTYENRCENNVTSCNCFIISVLFIFIHEILNFVNRSLIFTFHLRDLMMIINDTGYLLLHSPFQSKAQVLWEHNKIMN